MPAASATSPVRTHPDRRAPPSGERATARIQSSSPSSPSTTSARAPTGAEQPASRVASTARSASTAARVAGRRAAASSATRSASSLRHSTASAPCPGAGQHLERVEHLGDLVERGRGGPVRRGRARRRRTRRSRPCRSGCRRCRGCRRSRGRGRAPASWAARRGEPVPTRLPTGSSPRVRPSRATTTSRGSSRVGTAARVMPSAGAVGRSLSEWTATSTSPRSSASRRALTKTPVPPIDGQRGRRWCRPRW